MQRGRVTERTFYPAMMDVIRRAGGSGVQEVSYDSIPDIVFDLRGRPWFLSVKIGQDLGTIKGAFIQYLRHKEDSGIKFGMLLLLPESARKIDATEEAVQTAVQSMPVTTLIDAGSVKDEVRDRSFPKVIDLLYKEIFARLERREHTYYPLPLVVSLLQQQVSEMMREIALDETTILRIVTDRELLMDIGHLTRSQTEAVARFLASYILLSQLLFLRLLFKACPSIFKEPILPLSHHSIRRAFSQILEINYRPIYSVDVLDAIPAGFLKDTFELIWGLEVERVRHDLPGRIFHELMPTEIRKMLAAFYTRPQAADILTKIAIKQSSESILDPACGSGTILVSAYRRKRELFNKEGKGGNPHKRFCEEEIFGIDIMPFAVHLTTANLSATDVATTIERAQIIQEDSLKLGPGVYYQGGLQLEMFQQIPTARTTSGDVYEVSIGKVDNILMNPPFTKVERGIKRFVDMSRYINRCGGEIGLWGHFIAFADVFLKNGGTFGAVIPINVLRGRESEKVRRILFKEWTPLYILKPTRNYGFSEWAEYRDILFIARKQKPKPRHKVKYCLIKKDLSKWAENDTTLVSQRVQRDEHLRSDYLDIDSHPLSQIQAHFTNLMWFCGLNNFSHRDTIIRFINKFSGILDRFPKEYFREGYRPVPKGVSKFLFLTRHSDDSRVRQAFLRFSQEGGSHLNVTSPLGASYKIERKVLTKTLRTPVGLSTMDITGFWDYITHKDYGERIRVCRAANFESSKGFEWDKFWANMEAELRETETKIVVSRRINPFSPSTHLIAFFSNKNICPSNQVNVILERDIERAKAVCTLLNSAPFLAQFFLLKEESTGRYIDIRFYDLYEMKVFPRNKQITSLVKVFEKYRKVKFPPLRNQLDIEFNQRYEEFWEKERKQWQQRRLWQVLGQPIQPSPQRLHFDLDVCKALNVKVSPEKLKRVYEVLVNEMIITRGLARD